MNLKSLRIVLVCHYAASLPDLLPLYNLLLSKGLYVRFLFSDGWLLGPEANEGGHKAQRIREEIQNYYSQEILEVDISDLITIKMQSEKKDLVFFLATHYLDSLPKKLIKILIDSSIYYTPYGYPIFEIENNLGITPSNRKKFEYIFVQDDLEFDVWANANPESKVINCPKPFAYKNSSLLQNFRGFNKNRVCISLHHNSILNQTSSGKGYLIYHLDELLEIIENNSDNQFLIRTHPILISKLQKLARETTTGLEVLMRWNDFVEKINCLPNSDFSEELDWEIDFARSGLIFTESPSLSIKGKYRFKFDLPISLNLGESTSNSKVTAKHPLPHVNSLSQMQEIIQKRRKYFVLPVLLKYLSFVHIYMYQRISRKIAWKHLQRSLMARD
jgi:hypothetical protein